MGVRAEPLQAHPPFGKQPPEAAPTPPAAGAYAVPDPPRVRAPPLATRPRPHGPSQAGRVGAVSSLGGSELFGDHDAWGGHAWELSSVTAG